MSACIRKYLRSYVHPRSRDLLQEAIINETGCTLRDIFCEGEFKRKKFKVVLKERAEFEIVKGFGENPSNSFSNAMQR